MRSSWTWPAGAAIAWCRRIGSKPSRFSQSVALAPTDWRPLAPLDHIAKLIGVAIAQQLVRFLKYRQRDELREFQRIYSTALEVIVPSDSDVDRLLRNSPPPDRSPSGS